MPKELGFVFYKNENEKEPVKEWLLSLSKEERHKIGLFLRKVQKGWPIGMPLVRPMGSGIYEIRVSLENKIARILFVIDGKDIVALHGFIKKTQKTPEKDLSIAVDRSKKIKRGYSNEK